VTIYAANAQQLITLSSSADRSFSSTFLKASGLTHFDERIKVLGTGDWGLATRENPCYIGNSFVFKLFNCVSPELLRVFCIDDHIKN
jgi:hypothetical protein